MLLTGNKIEGDIMPTEREVLLAKHQKESTDTPEAKAARQASMDLISVIANNKDKPDAETIIADEVARIIPIITADPDKGEEGAKSEIRLKMQTIKDDDKKLVIARRAAGESEYTAENAKSDIEKTESVIKNLIHRTKNDRSPKLIINELESWRSRIEEGFPYTADAKIEEVIAAITDPDVRTAVQKQRAGEENFSVADARREREAAEAEKTEVAEEKDEIANERMLIGDEAGVEIEKQIAATQELGWKAIELRFVKVGDNEKGNIVDIPYEQFEVVKAQLAEAGIKVPAFGLGIMNWQKTVDTENLEEITMAEVERAIPRMQALGATFARVMSIKPGDDVNETPEIAYELLRKVTERFAEAGITTVHENCANHCGMSVDHTVLMLENVPGIELLYDTGNPVFNPDRLGENPEEWEMQDPQDWLDAIEKGNIDVGKIKHVHIKDLIYTAGAEQPEDYTFPGEGNGKVKETVKLLLSKGYTGGFSMEPHMVQVFHDADREADADAPTPKENAVEYGKKFDELIKDVQAELLRDAADKVITDIRDYIAAEHSSGILIAGKIQAAMPTIREGYGDQAIVVSADLVAGIENEDEKQIAKDHLVGDYSKTSPEALIIKAADKALARIGQAENAADRTAAIQEGFEAIKKGYPDHTGTKIYELISKFPEDEKDGARSIVSQLMQPPIAEEAEQPGEEAAKEKDQNPENEVK